MTRVLGVKNECDASFGGEERVIGLANGAEGLLTGHKAQHGQKSA